MPYATSRGRRIHYTLEGSGPLVVLQHGFLVDGRSWKTAGVVDVLADRYAVACVDSLGHGLSDKPAEAAAYALTPRAADIVAVIDHVGRERAHLIGHSMGGWMAVGVARRHPGRLASLAIGGWEPARGVASVMPPGMAPPAYEAIMAGARSAAPQLVDWVTPEIEPGLKACWSALSELDGAEAALLGLEAPLLLWAGREDPYHGPMQALAAARGLQFLSAAGDHMGSVLLHGPETGRMLRAFLDRCGDAG